MANFFFYGTLCHLPLLEKVLGYRPALFVAELPDYEVYWALDESYPVIVPHLGRLAKGLLVKDLSKIDIAKLDFYEGGFGYDTHKVNIIKSEELLYAQVYFPLNPAALGAVWSLSDWQMQWSDIVVEAAGEFMALLGLVAPKYLLHRYPMMLARAASRLRARTQNVDFLPSLRRNARIEDVTVENVEQPYAKFFAIEEYRLRFSTFAGPQSASIERAVFISADAVTILPYDPKSDLVMLIEQLRTGPLARGEEQVWLLETIAGRIDAGEAPHGAAYREAQEEAGLKLQALLPIAKSYPSPGANSEYLYSFLGITDLTVQQDDVFGLASEDENIKTHIMPFAAMMDLLKAGEINTTPLVMSALWLNKERTELMANARLT